ncbi:unnamed protein product [Rotaria magnacalcarata]|uniref:Uncharacterized protein n=3 Tax=Rotaria magnacalcarata TaxID=392030 RepID=A0A815HVQ3_9BILA|nr:unnamed protein product [Rotaria magnacalcarata]CAF1580605.1 unnamed protein product [Rotaria magnacalcarata]CAF1958191.1 unnamed protein product [Rotaria magnacalcarata]CAF2149754.1 unnamed protein product [Rotaria magnacalcarata]CAF3957654.1 unnamed protein product [Rotaria magnacalcarata]
MDTTVINSEEQRQLVPMSSLSQEKNSNEEDTIIVTSETNDSMENETPKKIKEKLFILRLCSNLKQNLTSLQRPHLSDSTLRLIFLLLIALIGLTSFTIALIMGSTIVQFKHQCPLYASFTFQTFITSESNWTVKIIPLTEKFSSQSTCDFCTFYNVFTFIYCIMTGFFFILFNGDQRIVATNDQCLIIPWFPISAILGIFSLINASILTNGFLKFCSTVTSNDVRVISCTQLNHLFFEQYPHVSSFFSYMLCAIISSWIQLTFFIGIITILTIRLGSSLDWNHEKRKKPSINIAMKSIEQT